MEPSQEVVPPPPFPGSLRVHAHSRTCSRVHTPPPPPPPPPGVTQGHTSRVRMHATRDARGMDTTPLKKWVVHIDTPTHCGGTHHTLRFIH